MCLTCPYCNIIPMICCCFSNVKWFSPFNNNIVKLIPKFYSLRLRFVHTFIPICRFIIFYKIIRLFYNLKHRSWIRFSYSVCMDFN